MTKKVYTTEFKQTLVSLYESGKTVSELSEEFEVSLASINRWKRLYGSTSSTSVSAINEDKKRIKDLEKKLKDAELERDILKKAVGIFSKSGR